MSIRIGRFIVVVGLTCVLALVPLGAQKKLPPKRSGAAAGQQLFASSCASCHGLDGRGTERAPNIAASRKVQRMSDEQVFKVISDGVPGTGMPAFHSLKEVERRRIVQHLRSLQGRSKASTVAGNPEQGKAIFFGKAECSGCHMIAGQGGFLGSDLTAYARTKSAQEIREAIVNPTLDPDPRTKLITATTRDGRTVTGILRNHDNFSVQIQTKDGSFRFLQRSDLTHVEYGPESIMPSDYAQQLTSKELDDVVKYLVQVARAQKSSVVVREEE